jgi:plastocyanin
MRTFTVLSISALLVLAVSACGDEHEHTVHVEFSAAPPATATAGTGFDVSWEVHNETEHDLHHSEIRVCSGAGVVDCGLGDDYESYTGSMTDGVFTATVTLDTAGMYTLVGWAHVGDDPYISDAFDVEVQ